VDRRGLLLVAHHPRVLRDDTPVGKTGVLDELHILDSLVMGVDVEERDRMNPVEAIQTRCDAWR
jgi:hypothetical protein